MAIILAAVVLLVSSAGAMAPAPAHAILSGTPQGSVGPWLGSSMGYVGCYRLNRYILAMGPYVGRANLYPAALETIWMQVRLERFYKDVAGGGWYVIKRNPWQWQNVQSGGYANFWEEEFWNIGGTAHYRVTYDFRWFANGKQIGSIITMPSGYEYSLGGDFGAGLGLSYTFDHGCYI
jgi:hypothetical protein